MLYFYQCFSLCLSWVNLILSHIFSQQIWTWFDFQCSIFIQLLIPILNVYTIPSLVITTKTSLQIKIQYLTNMLYKTKGGKVEIIVPKLWHVTFMCWSITSTFAFFVPILQLCVRSNFFDNILILYPYVSTHFST